MPYALHLLTSILTVLTMIGAAHLVAIGLGLRGPLRWQFFSIGGGIGLGFLILFVFDFIVHADVLCPEASWTAWRRLPFRACVCAGVWGYLAAFRKLGIDEAARERQRLQRGRH